MEICFLHKASHRSSSSYTGGSGVVSATFQARVQADLDGWWGLTASRGWCRHRITSRPIRRTKAALGLPMSENVVKKGGENAPLPVLGWLPSAIIRLLTSLVEPFYTSLFPLVTGGTKRAHGDLMLRWRALIPIVQLLTMGHI